MYWGVALFQGLCWLSLLALVGTYTWLSVRQHRVHPGLWLALGIFVMSWLESPYDNVMFAVFHPDFYRLPSWPLINLTQGGLPVIAPTGYIMYFLLPAAIAVPIGRWAVRRYRWREPYALLGVGLMVGMVFDAVIETSQASFLHLWTFARTTPGLTVFPGTAAQVPVTVYLAMGLFMMVATYLLGRRIDDEPVLDRWVATKVRPGPARTVAVAVAYVAVTHAVYLATMAPHAITKHAGMLTVAGPEQPYPGIAPQPAGVQANGAVGTLILVVWLVGLAVGAFLLARRFDPAAATGRDAAKDASAQKVPAHLRAHS
jgi:hypothetical protein